MASTSLTLRNVGRYDYLASKEVERKNSGTKRKSAPVRQCGFFTPAQFMGGRATDKTPERERSPLGLVRVLNLLPASRVARKNVLVRSFKTHQGAFTMSNTISIGSSKIRCINGLYSLNDLHKASGGEDRHQPRYFLAIQQTKDLISEIQNSGNPLFNIAIKITQGRNGGTYACRELVIAYAAWISPAFHLKVIRVFLAQVGRTLPEPETISKVQQGELATLIAERFTSGKDRPYAWSRFNNHFRLASYKDLPASKFNEACAYIADMTPPALQNPDADIAMSILRDKRFSFNVDYHGTITLQVLPDNPYQGLAKAIADPTNIGLKDETIEEIGQACVIALAHRAKHRESLVLKLRGAK